MTGIKEFLRHAARAVSFTRTVAVVTVTAFVLTSVAGPAAYAMNAPLPGTAQKIKESLGGFQLPYSVGRITDAKYLGSKKVVVAIQDLHCHPAVQRNIAKILGILDEKYGAARPTGFKVYVEGGTGAIDTSWVNKVSDQKVREGAVESLMNAGRLTGAEYYSIKTGKYTLLRGLEDAQPYYENLTRLNEIMDKRGEIAAQMPAIVAALAKVKGLYYTGGNRRLDQIVAKHEARTIETEKYYKLLLKLGGRTEIDPYYFPATANFLEVMALQRRLRYKSVNRELKKFIGSLQKKLPYPVYNQLVERANRPNGIEEVYVTLAQIGAGMDLSQYPSLAKFFAFVEKNQKMNPLDLVREDRLLVAELRGRLSQSRAEREVAFIADFLKYVQAYYENRMSADDYAYYSKNAAEFRLLWKRYARANLLPSLDAYNGLFSKFYGVNIERNRIFLDKVGITAAARGTPALTAGTVEENIFLMNSQLAIAEANNDVAVVVTGGFHTQGLSKMLEEKGISYVVITPNAVGDTAYAQRMYDIIAREFSVGNAAEAVMSRAISARAGGPSEDSLALLVASHQFADLTQENILAYAAAKELQSAAVKLAGAGMSAKEIAGALKKRADLKDTFKHISAVGGAVVFTASNGKTVSVVISDDADVTVASSARAAPLLTKVSLAKIENVNKLYKDSPDRLTQVAITISAVLASMGVAHDMGDALYLAVLKYGKDGSKSSALPKLGRGTGDVKLAPMLTEDQIRSLMGVEQLPELMKNAARYRAAAKRIRILHLPTLAGIGSTFARRAFLQALWPELQAAGLRDKAQEPAESTKAVDSIFRQTIDGKTVLMSIAEQKLLRMILERKQFSSTEFTMLISEDSKASVLALLDTVNVFERNGLAIPKEYGVSSGKKLTYRRIFEKLGTLSISENAMTQAALPVVVTENGQQYLSTMARAPGGHGVWGFKLLLKAARGEIPVDAAHPSVGVLYNAEDVSAFPDPVIAGWLTETGAAMVMLTTDKSDADVKGGQLGILIENGVTRLVMPESADAQRNGQVSAFDRMGLAPVDIDGKPTSGRSFFNTNTVYANFNVLNPILQVMLDALGETEFLKIIAPTYMDNSKQQQGTGANYIQMEGTIGTVVLNLNAYLCRTNNPKILAALRRYNLLSDQPAGTRVVRFLRVINVPLESRTDQYAATKKPSDIFMHLYADLFDMETKTWKLKYNRHGSPLPSIELDSYYADVQTVLDAFRQVSIIGLFGLQVGGKVIMPGAVLRGRVEIQSAAGTVVDLNTLPALQQFKQGDTLVLENIKISIDANNTVTTAAIPAAARQLPGAILAGPLSGQPERPESAGRRAEGPSGLTLGVIIVSITNAMIPFIPQNAARSLADVVAQFVKGGIRREDGMEKIPGLTREAIREALAAAGSGYSDVEIWRTYGVVKAPQGYTFVAMTTDKSGGRNKLLVNEAFIDYLARQGKSADEIIKIVTTGARHENLEDTALNAQNSPVGRAFDAYYLGLKMGVPTAEKTPLVFHDFLRWVSTLRENQVDSGQYGITHAEAVEQAALLDLVEQASRDEASLSLLSEKAQSAKMILTEAQGTVDDYARQRPWAGKDVKPLNTRDAAPSPSSEQAQASEGLSVLQKVALEATLRPVVDFFLGRAGREMSQSDFESVVEALVQEAHDKNFRHAAVLTQWIDAAPAALREILNNKISITAVYGTFNVNYKYVAPYSQATREVFLFSLTTNAREHTIATNPGRGPLWKRSFGVLEKEGLLNMLDIVAEAVKRIPEEHIEGPGEPGGTRLLLPGTIEKILKDYPGDHEEIRAFIAFLGRPYAKLDRGEKAIFNKWMRIAVKIEHQRVRDSLVSRAAARDFVHAHEGANHNANYDARMQGLDQISRRVTSLKIAEVIAVVAALLALVIGLGGVAMADPISVSLNIYLSAIQMGFASGLAFLGVIGLVWKYAFKPLNNAAIDYFHLRYNRAAVPDTRLIAGTQPAAREALAAVAEAAPVRSPAGSLPGMLTGAAVRAVAMPVDHFPALQGLYSVAAARLTQADVDETVSLANATGVNAVLCASVSADEFSAYVPYGNSDSFGTRMVETTEGSVTLFVFVRGEESDAQLITAACQAAAAFRGDLALAGDANPALRNGSLRDGKNGLKLTVLVLKGNPSDPAVLETLMQETGQKPVVVASREVVEAGKRQTAYDGVLDRPANGQDPWSPVALISQLGVFNQMALYKNARYTAPAPMIAATTASVGSAEQVSHAVMVFVAENNEKRVQDGPDTVLFSVPASARKDQSVLQALGRARQTLHMAGLWMGLYVDVTSENATDTSWIDSMVSPLRIGAAVVYLNNKNASKAQIKKIIEAINAANPDTVVKVQGETPDGFIPVATEAGLVQANGDVLATTENVGALETNPKAQRASMIIMDPGLSGAVADTAITAVPANSPVSIWRRLAGKVRASRSKDAGYKRDQGRRDGLRNSIDSKYLLTADGAGVAASIIAASGNEQTAAVLRNILALPAAADVLQRALVSSGVGLAAPGVDSQDAETAYIAGVIQGVLEAHFANEEKGQVLTQMLRALYGKVRFQQFLLGVPAQSAAQRETGQTAVDKILEPLAQAQSANAVTDVVLTTAMTAVQQLSAYARSVERTDPVAQRAALAAIIEILQVYGERSMKATVYDETRQIVPVLVRDMLGAA